MCGIEEISGAYEASLIITFILRKLQTNMFNNNITINIIIIIIIYSGYPLQLGPANIMYNTMRCDTIQYIIQFNTISFFRCSFYS